MDSPSGKPLDAERPDRRRTSIVLSSVGEVVEWFDFMIYLALAPILAKVFFPTGDPLTSLFATLGIFAAAYLARPLGAIVFGGLGDRVGRKATLVISALVMAIAKLIEGSLPSYDAVGIAAPILFVLARMLSGLSLGGEFTGTFIMLFETAKPGQRAMMTSLGNVMSGIGVLLASGLVALLVGALSAEAMQDWGWRIPFYAGALVCFAALAIRLWVRETPPFRRLQERGEVVKRPLIEAVRRQPRGIALTFAMSGFNALTYYLVIAFVATFLQSDVGMDHATALTITTAAALFNVVFIPIPGWISDRIGRRPVLIFACLFFAIFGYPLFTMLASGAFVPTLIAALIFVIPAGCFMGPSNAATAEHLPTRLRYSAFALGYNIGTGLFGGFTPLIAIWLIHATGSNVAPSVYLIAAALVMLVVTWRLRETYRVEIV